MANGGDEHWWTHWMGELIAAALALFATIYGAIAYVVRDRVDIQRKLDEHDQKLGRILEVHERWDGGHALNRESQDIKTEMRVIVAEMRADIRNLQARLDRWSNRQRHNDSRGDDE